MTNSNIEVPSFMYGSFSWRENGYFWERPADINLLSSSALTSENPWIILSSVVEYAKQGDHSKSILLANFFENHQIFALDRISLLVFADIAPDSEIYLLEEALHSKDQKTRCLAAEAAVYAGHVKLIPGMLNAWKLASDLDSHETIGFAISDLLEQGSGPIAENAGIYNLTEELNNIPPH